MVIMNVGELNWLAQLRASPPVFGILGSSYDPTVAIMSIHSGEALAPVAVWWPTNAYLSIAWILWCGSSHVSRGKDLYSQFLIRRHGKNNKKE